MFNKFELQRTL